MAYPTDLPTDTASAGTSLLSSPDHSSRHNTIGSAVVGIATTLGTNSGTAVIKDFVAGNFAMRMNSSNVPQHAISSGTINNAIVGTPRVTGGTITSLIGTSTIQGGTANNQVVGTPTVTGGAMNIASFGTPTIVTGSDATGDMYYKSAGGTVTRLGIGSSGQVVTTDGTTPSWGAASSVVRGFGYTGAGDGTLTSLLGTVTFSTPFAAVPIIILGNAGHKNGSDPTTPADFSASGGVAGLTLPSLESVGTASFVVRIGKNDETAITSGRRQVFHWMAISAS